MDFKEIWNCRGLETALTVSTCSRSRTALSWESTLGNGREKIFGFRDINLCSWEGESSGVSDKYTEVTELTWFCPYSTEDRNLADL